MDLVLTSFGLGMREHERSYPFHRMPPLIMHETTGRFSLDYAGLLMFDRVIVDERGYERILDTRVSDEPWMTDDMKEKIHEATREYVDFLKSLEKAGRLLPRNFDDLLSQNRDVLEQALNYDMKNLTEWVDPLEVSLEKWNGIMERLRQGCRRNSVRSDAIDEEESRFCRMLAHDLGSHQLPIPMYLESLKKWKKKQPSFLRERSREFLRDYLSYVNVNIILSYEHESPFIDWEDLQPFYDRKFRNAGRREQPAKGTIDQSRKLFEVMFPYFIPRDHKALARAIEDNRIEQLRELVSGAVAGKVEFDSEFAVRTLKDVLNVERFASLRRRVTGWATLPLGLVPVVGTGIQKAAEEGINAIWSGRPLRKYSWFYLINELDAGCAEVVAY